MKKKDKDRYQLISKVLGDVGIRNFLILGLREKGSPQDQDGETESFYCLSAIERPLLIGALTNIFLNSPDIGELLIGILHKVYHDEKKKLEELAGFGIGAGPIARA